MNTCRMHFVEDGDNFTIGYINVGGRKCKRFLDAGKWSDEIIDEDTEEAVDHVFEAKFGQREEIGMMTKEEVAEWVEDQRAFVEKNMKRGIKETSGKLRFDLIPPEAMVELAKVYTEGSLNYGDRDWEKGIPTTECVGAIKRHLTRFELGMDIGPKGVHELARSAFWCLAIVSQYYRDVKVEDCRKERKVDLEQFKDFLKS